MIKADFRKPRLPRIAKPPDVGGGGDAIFVIGIDVRHGAARISDCNDAITFISQRKAPVRRAGAFVPNK